MEFGNSIVGASDELVRDGIQSRGFVAGSTGWRIDRNGNAEFNSVTLRGSLTASDGTDSVVITNTSNPRIQFFKNGVVLPAEILGTRPFGTGDTGMQFETAGTAGHTQAIMQLDEFGFRVFDAAASSVLFGIDYPGTDPEVESAHADSIGGVSTLLSNGTGTMLTVCVDGKVGTGTTTTAIGTTDTNISSANAVNVPVIADRAYRVIVQLDYFRSTTGALARMDMKLWNGAVGGTQIGGTSRIPMAGPLSTARRTLVGNFVWRAVTTQVIANLNVSLATTDTTVGQNWTAEVNAGYSIIIEEIGPADNISNL